jgi:hypothetical protein
VETETRAREPGLRRTRGDHAVLHCQVPRHGSSLSETFMVLHCQVPHHNSSLSWFFTVEFRIMIHFRLHRDVRAARLGVLPVRASSSSCIGPRAVSEQSEGNSFDLGGRRATTSMPTAAAAAASRGGGVADSD